MVPCASRASRLLHSAFVPRRPPDRAEGLRGARKPAATGAAPVAARRSAYRIVQPPSTGRVTPVNDLAASERLLRRLAGHVLPRWDRALRHGGRWVGLDAGPLGGDAAGGGGGAQET